MILSAKKVLAVAAILAVGISAGQGCTLESKIADGQPFFANEVSPTEIAHVGTAESLDCAAVNFCSITWYKDGIPFPWRQQGDAASQHFEDKKQFLLFKTVDVTDGGEYTCVVSNGEQQISRTKRLVVIEESYNGAPIPLGGERGSCADQTAMLGQTVRFICEFYVGKERHTLSSAGWLKATKDGDIPAEWMVDVETETEQSYRNDSIIVAHLQINNINANGFGTWKVYVENGFPTEVTLAVIPVPTEHILGATGHDLPLSDMGCVGSGGSSSSDGSAGTITLLTILLAVVSSLLLLTVGLLISQSLRNRRIARIEEVEPETKNSDCSKSATIGV